MTGRWTTPADNTDHGRQTTDGGRQMADVAGGAVGVAGVARRTDVPHRQLRAGAKRNTASRRSDNDDRVSAQAAPSELMRVRR